LRLLGRNDYKSPRLFQNTRPSMFRSRGMLAGVSAPTGTAARRGRPAAASREDVLGAALRRYLHGERVDVQSLAGELGLGRTTIYRWFGSRDRLIGEVLIRAADPVLDEARAQAHGRGAPALLDAFDHVNRIFAAAPALRQFVEQERETALRIMTSGSGIVQPHMVSRIRAWIEEEVERGAYDPPVDSATLAYAIVRLAEAFIYNDTGPGLRSDVDRLREVEAALLGIRL
jgi:AcrR family transcriptional regulator